MTITAEGLTIAYGQSTIIDDITMSIAPGKITAILGANGCGKSTLLRALSRMLTPSRGFIKLHGKSIQKYDPKFFARQVAFLPQSPVAPDGLTVLELVKQGRYPHQTWLQQWTAHDEDVVRQAMDATGVSALADRPLNNLSGGQRQRAWIAMVLAQDSHIILLDEPTTYLDINHQLELLDLLNRLNADNGKTIVMVLHELGLACRYAHEVIVMHNKQVVAQGTPSHVITEDLLKRVFSIDCKVGLDPVFNTPLLLSPRALKKEGLLAGD